MSLINDALKKAQRDRNDPTVGAPAFTTDPAPSTTPELRRGRPSGPPVLWIGITALLAASLVLVLLVLVLRSHHPAPVTPAPDPVAATVAKEPATAGPAATAGKPVPSLAQTDKPATATAFQLNLSVPAAAATPPLPTQSDGKVAAESRPAATPSAPAPAAEAPASALQPDKKMVDLIEGFRVTGIRATGKDSKVLMNDRVYRLHDIVNADQGIRLIEVAADALTFRDARGAVYTRHF